MYGNIIYHIFHHSFRFLHKTYYLPGLTFSFLFLNCVVKHVPLIQTMMSWKKRMSVAMILFGISVTLFSQTQIGGVISAADYPEGGEGRNTRLN